MRGRTRSLAALAVAATTAAAVPAAPDDGRAAPTHQVAVAIDEALTVSGGPGAGTNANYFTDYECDSDPDTYCETVLVELSNPYEEENATKGRERATLQLDLVPTTYPAELDMALYESDADGAQGAQIAQAGTFAIVDCESGCETISAVVTTTEDVETTWVLVHVVYFAAAGEYDLDISYSS